MNVSDLKKQIISLIDFTNDKDTLEDILSILTKHHDVEEYLIKLDERLNGSYELTPNIEGIKEQDLEELRNQEIYGDDLALNSRDEKEKTEEKELLMLIKSLQSQN